MMKSRVRVWGFIPLILGANLAARGEMIVKLGGGPGGIEGLKLVPSNGITARMEQAVTADDGKPAVKVTFTKSDQTRRFLALEARPKSDPVGARAVALRYRLQLTKGEAPRLAVTIYEQGGGAWFKVGGQPLGTGVSFAEGRLSVSSLRQAAFSEDADGQLGWDQIEKVWIGLVFDGPAAGVLEISQARFTTEPYKPTQPLRLTGDGPGTWTLGADPAVQGKITTPNEGPNGKPCMKFEFQMPGRRHMYALPATTLPSLELDGYSALRFTYKANLPPGINGLLVTLSEQTGGQYFADPAPPASADWTTLSIPFSRFSFATWSKDQNEKLDLDQLGGLLFGLHGAASVDTATGAVWVTDLEFVP